MIIEIRAKNIYAFLDEVRFSMKADMRNKRFASNVHMENNFNVLKSVGVYGPNNAGKTCLVRCISVIKYALLNQKTVMMSNMFNEDPVCELGVTFLNDGKKYSYDFRYDTESNEYTYERFSQMEKDQYGNEKEIVWLLMDQKTEEYECLDKGLEDMISLMAKNNLLMYLMDTKKFPHLDAMKNIVTSFASKIDVINMDNIPIQKTIDMMKNKNSLQDKIVQFIKNADLYLDDFRYVPMDRINVKSTEGESDPKPSEKALDIPESVMDQIRLVSTYRGVDVPSMIFDSTGTKKIAALASYIIEGLQEGRILVVDELDSSIHFKLTRAIVAMFNNELNTNAQLIFTVHDINLMDVKRLFRKEQIWFVHKDNDGVYVYSLADFTAKDGVRDTSDVMEKYRKGLLGALPDPELINSLLDLKGNKKGAQEDEE